MLMTCVDSRYAICLLTLFSRWVPNQVPDEQCFEAIKAGIDLLPPGVKMVINSGKLEVCLSARLALIVKFLCSRVLCARFWPGESRDALALL